MLLALLGWDRPGQCAGSWVPLLTAQGRARGARGARDVRHHRPRAPASCRAQQNRPCTGGRSHPACPSPAGSPPGGHLAALSQQRLCLRHGVRAGEEVLGVCPGRRSGELGTASGGQDLTRPGRRVSCPSCCGAAGGAVSVSAHLHSCFGYTCLSVSSLPVSLSQPLSALTLRPLPRESSACVQVPSLPRGSSRL